MYEASIEKLAKKETSNERRMLQVVGTTAGATLGVPVGALGALGLIAAADRIRRGRGAKTDIGALLPAMQYGIPVGMLAGGYLGSRVGGRIHDDMYKRKKND